MKVVVEGERGAAYGGRFTAPVELEMLHRAESDGRPDVARVHFSEGAVTHWHAHPGGQLLVVLAGRARVGTEADGARSLDPGTLVVAPPNERHWHGAAAGASAVLLAVTWGTTAWEDARPEGLER
jgi:quercetin dioxygenase-like cupin family protein